MVSLFPEFFDSDEHHEEPGGRLVTSEDDVNQDDILIDSDAEIKSFVYFDADAEEWKSQVGPWNLELYPL